MDRDTDRLFDALADPDRRRLLAELLSNGPETESPVSLDSPLDAISTDDATRIEYRHRHLPKLADYGFVEWTPGDRVVERGPRFDEIEPALRSSTATPEDEYVPK